MSRVIKIYWQIVGFWGDMTLSSRRISAALPGNVIWAEMEEESEDINREQEEESQTTHKEEKLCLHDYQTFTHFSLLWQRFEMNEYTQRADLCQGHTLTILTEVKNDLCARSLI